MKRRAESVMIRKRLSDRVEDALELAESWYLVSFAPKLVLLLHYGERGEHKRTAQRNSQQGKSECQSSGTFRP